MKNRIRLAIGLLLSLLFLYLAVRGIQLDEIWDLLRQAQYLYLVPVFLLIVLVSWIRAIRWHLLMERDPELDVKEVFHLVNIGYFFNNVLPAKAGEAARAYLAGRKLRGGFGQAVSTLLIERLLDVLSVVVLLVVLLPSTELPDWAIRGGLLFGTAAIGATVALWIVARIGPRAVEWLWRWIGRVPFIGDTRVKQAFTNLVLGFGVLTDWRRLPGIVGTTAGVWVGYVLMNYVGFSVFGLQGQSPWAAALVVCATGFSMIVPSSPGAIGPFEWAGVQALAVFGVEQSVAFAYTLGIHLFTNFTLIILGGVGLFAQGLSYARIARVAQETAPEAPVAPPARELCMAAEHKEETL